MVILYGCDDKESSIQAPDRERRSPAVNRLRQWNMKFPFEHFR